MSIILGSALAALAVATVPPSIGSEPVPANFEYQPSAATHVALMTPNLDASLGSEPTFVGMDEAPRVLNPGQRAVASATLAASLGSEPFIVAFDEEATPAERRSDESRSDDRIAQNCTCR